MDTLRNPTGPLPTGTYWRRRLIVLAVLLAVVGGVVWACTRNSDAGQKPVSAASSSSALPTVPSETATPTVTETPGASGSSSGTPTASGSKSGSASPSVSKRGGKTICPTDDVRVSVRSDQKFYAANEDPKFTVIIVNLRKSTCYIDMGKEAAYLKVISGKDRVWSNVDCSRRKAEDLRKFASGDVYTSTVTWKRTRSAEGCKNTDIEAKPGYYVVDARVGKAKPKDRPVFVLRES
ncbi:MAG: hypothetical protein GEV07_30000 [Streptosporangiales bacterium]|nr:hypothetical protein [Streptosporangiales bacterium]